jgi:hypothetical protein
MSIKNSTVAAEHEIVELVLGLLEDFEEHAEAIKKAKRRLETAEPGSDGYYEALAQVEAWMTGLTALVPGILEELDRLDEIPE